MSMTHAESTRGIPPSTHLLADGAGLFHDRGREARCSGQADPCHTYVIRPRRGQTVQMSARSIRAPPTCPIPSSARFPPTSARSPPTSARSIHAPPRLIETVGHAVKGALAELVARGVASLAGARRGSALRRASRCAQMEVVDVRVAVQLGQVREVRREKDKRLERFAHAGRA